MNTKHATPKLSRVPATVHGYAVVDIISKIQTRRCITDISAESARTAIESLSSVVQGEFYYWLEKASAHNLVPDNH